MNEYVCCIMNTSSKHYAKWKNPGKKDHILHELTCLPCLEQGNLKIQKVDLWLPRAGAVEEE